MGFSLFGGLAWLAALFGSLLWPGLLAWGYSRWQSARIADRERFLSWGIPLAYLVILGLHALLGRWILAAAEADAAARSWMDLWGPVIAVLLIENGLALVALNRLQAYQRAAPRR